MLYLIGGASRAGKSLLAQRWLVEQHVPYLPLDLLLIGLARGVPAVPLDPPTRLPGDRLWPVLGDTVWPLLHAMALSVLEEGSSYLFEGAALQPSHAVALREVGGDQIRACFLGYAGVRSEEKLRDLRRFDGGAGDWVHGRTDEQLRVLIREMAEYSRSVQHDCALYGLRYIDTGSDFEQALGSGIRYLAEGP